MPALPATENHQPPANSVTVEPGRRSLPALALAAVGIVFGDIGTSPLYAMSTVFDPQNGLALTHGNLVGVIS